MAQVLERCEDLVLASVDGDGFPRPVPMCKIHSSGINEIWVSTGADSVKFAQFMWAADSLSGEKWDARNLNKLGTDAGEIYMEAAIRTLEYL